MKSRFWLSVRVVVMTAGLLPLAAAQAATASERLKPNVVRVKLSPPVYPVLARQAGISGDVSVS